MEDFHKKDLSHLTPEQRKEAYENQIEYLEGKNKGASNYRRGINDVAIQLYKKILKENY